MTEEKKNNNSVSIELIVFAHCHTEPSHDALSDEQLSLAHWSKESIVTDMAVEMAMEKDEKNEQLEKPVIKMKEQGLIGIVSRYNRTVSVIRLKKIDLIKKDAQSSNEIYWKNDQFSFGVFISTHYLIYNIYFFFFHCLFYFYIN